MSERARAYAEVLDLLDRDIARFKECGDSITADVIEVVRAKVQATAHEPRSTAAQTALREIIAYLKGANGKNEDWILQVAEEGLR